jgi:hypothetical protein
MSLSGTSSTPSSISSTHNETGTWWKVDLEDVTVIGKVVIYRRTERLLLGHASKRPSRQVEAIPRGTFGRQWGYCVLRNISQQQSNSERAHHYKSTLQINRRRDSYLSVSIRIIPITSQLLKCRCPPPHADPMIGSRRPMIKGDL